MTHASAVAIAATAAPILRAVIHRIEARTDWTPEQKRFIPWVCIVLGAVVVAVSALAGLPIDEAVILGGGAPGAVVVNELLGSRKPPVPPAALVLVALALGGCSHEERGVGIVLATILGAGACLAMLAMQVAAFRARRLAGIRPALALALLASLSGCHLSHGTRAGVAFVGTVPTIEAGVRSYRAERPKMERAIADEADAACKGSPTVAEFDACREAIVVPKRKALDDVRLGVGSYGATIVAVAKGQDGDLAAAAQKVIALLGAIGIRVMQEVK